MIRYDIFQVLFFVLPQYTGYGYGVKFRGSNDIIVAFLSGP